MSILCQHILSAVIAYLIGSVSFSKIFAKAIKKQDINKLGSGNAGTTNMLRTFGWKLGLLTLACDLLKGVLAVFISYLIGGELAMLVACIFAVVGHNFSVFMKFKGGKGIATTTGVMLSILPIQTIIIFGSCVGIVFLTKIMSIGSIIGAIATAVIPIIMYPDNTPLIITVIILCALDLFSHRSNIVRLFQGKENKLHLSHKNNMNEDKNNDKSINI